MSDVLLKNWNHPNNSLTRFTVRELRSFRLSNLQRWRTIFHYIFIYDIRKPGKVRQQNLRMCKKTKLYSCKSGPEAIILNEMSDDSLKNSNHPKNRLTRFTVG